MSTSTVDAEREASVSTSMVDAQGRLLCPHQRLTLKGGFSVHVNG